ncbi:MAG TPA: Hsp20/alpha crystallin family protein [Nitrospirota bacterium]
MSLVPWDPFRNLVALQDRMNRMFEETVQAGKETEMMRPGTWAPVVDIYEDEEEVVLVAEVPGIEMEDVDIQVRDNTLTLKGERKMEKPVNKENYHRVERTYGSFMRAFTLPSTVDQDKISANYAKGVLEIKMPKSARSKPTQIKIDVKE